MESERDEVINVDMDAINVEPWLKPGTYYAECVDAQPMTGKRGDKGIELTWKALHPEAAMGRKTRDRLWTNGDASPRLKLAARALGLRDHGQNVAIRLDDLIGQRAWIEVEHGKPWIGDDGFERKGNDQIGWDGYDVVTPPPEGLNPSAAAPAPAPAAKPPAKPAPSRPASPRVPF